MNTKVTTCLTQSTGDHVIIAMTWLKEYNSHYRDIKLNEHWYSGIASREFSVQLDESDNHITVNKDAVQNQSLKTADISKEKWNKDDNQQLCTAQIESTNIDNYWHWKWWRYWTSWRANCNQPQTRINRWPIT